MVRTDEISNHAIIEYQFNSIIMKALKNYVFPLVLMLCFVEINAQNVAINTDGSSPNANAMLDIKSSTMGVLVPRMTSVQKTSFGAVLTLSEAGMLVYDTDVDKFFFWDGTIFKQMGTAAILIDTDGDTKIQVEETPDDDIIRFDIAGVQQWLMTGERLEPGNPGGHIYIGEGAGEFDSLSSSSNIAVGRSALARNNNRSGIVAVGDSALYNNGVGAVNSSDGQVNTAVGFKALRSNTIGWGNTAVGNLALEANESGDVNTALGFGALFLNTTGIGNTASGGRALRSNEVGIYNTANGYQAMYLNDSGSLNTAMGYGTMYNNAVGSANTATGMVALTSNTIGQLNTASGYSALWSNTIGSSNTASGVFALYSNTSGSGNTAVGDSALYFNTTGSGNTAIGLNADVGIGNLTNATAIGANAKVDVSNAVILGNDANVGIGLSFPYNRLDVRSDGISEDTTEIVLGLISDLSNRPVLQFSEWGFAVPGSGMSIEYDGVGTGINNKLHIRGVDALRKYTFTSGGRLGIGETNPNESLEIAGNGRMFIGDGGGTARRGLLIDAIEAGDYVRIVPFDYGTSTNMDLYLPSNVNIGTSTGALGYMLSVNGKIMAEELKVQMSETWPDYVFSENYALPSIPELEKSIIRDGRLPGMPSADDVEVNGFEVGEMNRLLLEKVEELTLYIIQQDKRIDMLSGVLEDLQNKN
jgi:trimeric autotransporter adhesin